MILLVIIVFFLSVILTGLIRRYALFRKIVDIPNHRSSHTAVTPRGGGLAIVLSLLVVLPFIYHCGLATPREIIALAFSGGIISWVGWMDDHTHISALYRFIIYVLASMWSLYWLHGMPTLVLDHWHMSSGIIANILAILYLSWMINLYNFMDGIDGIAAIQAIFVCISATILYWCAGSYSLMGVPLLLAASVAGFLYWNLPPARIFMGDVGSCFLGFMLGGLSIHAAAIKPEFFWSWLILLSVFIVDATLTLARRAMHGNKIYQAHRNHAYQHAAQKFSHRTIDLFVVLLNIIWTLPLAISVGLHYLSPIFGLLLAYIPLTIIALYFKAGVE